MYQFVYDAWNRLVRVKAGQGDHSTFATYHYDGAGRRVRKVLTNSGELDGTEHYYYDGSKQIEMRAWLAGEGRQAVSRQYVWGTQYIDELVRMDVNGGDGTYDYLDAYDDGSCVTTGDASYYYHQDANYNVVAVTLGSGEDVNGALTTGDVVQRLSFTSYGRPTFTDGDGILQRCFSGTGNTTDPNCMGS